MVPPAEVLEIGQAGMPAVLAVDHMVRFAASGGLSAAAGELTPLVPQGHQPPQVQRDVVGLALVPRQAWFAPYWILRANGTRGLVRGTGRSLSRYPAPRAGYRAESEPGEPNEGQAAEIDGRGNR